MGEFTCDDVFNGCPERVDSGSLEELLARVTQHVQQRHGLEEVSPELVERVVLAVWRESP